MSDPNIIDDIHRLRSLYNTTRDKTLDICSHLATEDFVVQPVEFVSPPKWHLGHTTWFFEEFILSKYLDGYQVYDDQYAYVFNSYYEGAGDRVVRTSRGNLSRPTVDEIKSYRLHVDAAMNELVQVSRLSPRLAYLIEVGCNHEQQHQELLYTDIKYILGNNPLQPHYCKDYRESMQEKKQREFLNVEEGVYTMGYQGCGFHYDNEKGIHKVYLNEFEISDQQVTNREYLQFINAGGYQNHMYWHSAGWAWVNAQDISAPMYWHLSDGKWSYYTLAGHADINLDAPVTHISFYEAFAFAVYKSMRLPTEQEWEVAADKFDWGQRWEWTSSAYLPYPNYEREAGALGEYNGKFMVGQQVLRGASAFTADGHSRKTYRNFFLAPERWQLTGIRLVKRG